MSLKPLFLSTASRHVLNALLPPVISGGRIVGWGWPHTVNVTARGR